MAALTAAKAAPGVSSSKQTVSRISTCSARVKPFTPAFKASRAQQKRQNFACKAAEEEEAVEAAEAAAAVDDFEFNFNDAKKNNTYNQSDVDAILEAYAEGNGEMAFNDEFFVNITDLEDAAIFEDVDNRDGYEDDMYSSAGIPEAAPVQKRGARDAGKAEEEEDDEALREIEEAKILEDELDQMGAEEQEIAGPWGWDISNDDFEDITVADDADDYLEMDNMPGDDELIAGIASADMQGLDEETQELIPVLLSDVPVEEISGLYDAAEQDDAELDAAIDAPVMSAEEEATIAEALGAEEPALQLTVAETDAADMPGADEEEAELDESMVQDYIKSLQAFASATGGEDVSSLVDDSAEEVSAPTGEVEAAVEAEFEVDSSLLEVEELLPEGEQQQEDSIADIVAEYKSLNDIAVEEWSEMEIPGDAELDVLDEYLDATGEYLQAMGVGSGTDDLEAAGAADEALNMYDDLDSSLIAPAADAAEEEQLQERLVQLSRVTKVVKGGKLMGFRAVAVVGNMKGRVGVGCDSGREVSVAVKRALLDAKRNVIDVPLVGAGTIPHRVEVRHHSALVVLRPASEGTGCIAGSSVRTVLELAGVQNVLAKRIGSRNLLNNARATVKALESLRTLEDVARARDLPLEYLRS